MTHQNNWLKVAISAEQPNAGPPQAANALDSSVTGMQQDNQPGTQPDIQPEATPTARQNVAKGKSQQRETERVRQVVLPQAAKIAIQTLNQTLQYVAEQLMTMAGNDLQLNANSARSLAIEVMAEWIAASRKGSASDDAVAGAVVMSKNVNQILDSAS